MKTYPIDLDGRPLLLRGLTADVKEELTDTVRARELNRNERLAKKKLISSEMFLSVQHSILAMEFASEAVVMFIETAEGSRALMRAMTFDPAAQAVTDADLDRLAELRRTDGHPVQAMVRLAFAEAYPKKVTGPPPTSTATPASGGPSSPATPSGSVPTSSAG
jgi:ATP-dependent DNA ligase